MNAVIPKSPITIRPAVAADIPFIDSLQKLHSHQVGWMPTKQLEGKIAGGQVIVAEECRHEGTEARRHEVKGEDAEMPSAFPSVPPCLRASVPAFPASPLGYCIAHDQYFKRDDVGIIYQMNVATGRQRELVGASLLKAQFERSAWGCKLYCCWCAQDIPANRFWESMGFVPLAFRAGSERKSRVHIFWQRRIRAGDTTTPYWFPAQTTGGSLREDRLVLPIPPGTHWADVMPRVLPGERVEGLGSRVLEDKKGRARSARDPRPKTLNPLPKAALGSPFRFAPPVEEKKPKTVKEPKRKRKNDPRLVSAARELRDRWLEQVNARQLVGEGKYDVSRAIEGRSAAVKRLAA